MSLFVDKREILFVPDSAKMKKTVVMT